MQYRFFVIIAATIIGIARCDDDTTVIDIRSNDTMCSFCTRNLEHALNKQNLMAVLRALEQYADKMPGHLGPQVKALLETFGPQAIQQLLDKYGPKEICGSFLHVCPTGAGAYDAAQSSAPYLAMFGSNTEDESA